MPLVITIVTRGLEATMNIANPKQIGNPGKSLALRYELMLKEEGAKSDSKATLTPERITMCFEIFDELLPQLGVFQRLMKMIRNELFTAVYSSDFTVGRHGNSSGNKRSPLQYIPHFAITKHHLDQHNEKVEQLKAANESLIEELSSCKSDLKKCSDALEAYQEKLADKQNELSIINKSLQQRNSENEKLKKSLGQQQRIQERIKQEAGYRMSSLQSTLHDISRQAAELKKYKDTFDGLNDAFSKRKDRSNEKHSVATERNHLRHSLHLSKVLHNQLLDIQNKSISEYEQHMNSHISDLSAVDNLDTHLEVIEYQEQFRQSMREIIEEITLTQAHIEKQQKRLDQLNALHSSGLGIQTAVSDPAHPANPLIPQEQVLNKYAAMVSTSSNNGKSFYPHQEAMLCESCGEKTVICPHRSFEKELILALPLHATHIRISRPYCREPPKCIVPQDVAPRLPLNVAKHKSKSFSLEPEFASVWQHYKQEFPDVLRHLPRQLSMEDTMTVIEQLYGNLLLDDDITANEDVQSIMDYLYSFMQDRYIIPEIMQLATCDFLSAVEEYCEVNKAMLLFGNLLCGKVDGSCFRYHLMMATYVSKAQLETSKDFHQFATIIYPFLQEDDVDQLTMDYVAYNENKFSQQSVLDFITYLILREKEPQIMEISSQLMEFNTYNPGSFTLLEFIEASDKMVSISLDHLRHHLYYQSLAGEEEGKKSLPINKTAQIIAYLLIQQHHQTVVAKLEHCQLGHDDIVRPISGFSTFFNVKNMASHLKNSTSTRKRRSSSNVAL